MENPRDAGTGEERATAPVGAAVDGVTADLAARVRLAVGRLSRRIARSDTHGLSQGQISALVTVEAYGPLSLGEVAAREGVAPPSVTRLVASLCEHALVTRSTDPTDRRSTQVSISDQGTRLLAQLRGQRTAALARRLADLDPAERDLLASALPVLERLTEWEPGPTSAPGPGPGPGERNVAS